MINCIIIDDEPLARSVVKEYLSAFPEIKLVAECNDGFEGVKSVMQHKPDLIFLDIQMPKISGFEMLELLDPAPAVIFTTAFDEYALKAFEMHAVDYLLKPFSKDRFAQAMKKWIEAHKTKNTAAEATALQNEVVRQPEEKERVVVRMNGEIMIVPSAEIYYIEAFDDYVKIFTKDNWFLKKKTMNYFEATLDKTKFLRAHRSFLINLTYLTRVEPYEKGSHIALLKNGSKIPLSRSGYSRLKEVLGI
jgi:two-component system, LytTR family, response regulator